LIHKCLENPVDQFNDMALMIDAGKHPLCKVEVPFLSYTPPLFHLWYLPASFIFQADLLTASLPHSVLGNAVLVAPSFSGICRRIA
jgi:hypothetical protein